MSTGDALLALAGHDREIARLRSLHEQLPERAALADAQIALGAVQTEHDEVDRRLAEVAREEQRIDTDAQDVARKADGVEKKLYSGEVTSPKELQALQADLESLRAHQHKIEDGELEVMERREEIATELATITAARDEVRDRVDAVAGALRAAEAEIDAALAAERTARDEAAAGVPAAARAAYDKAHRLAGTDGAARLVGLTCQGCHLSIGTIEAEAIRRSPDTFTTCENCNRILVP